jgi:hypothetical protein
MISHVFFCGVQRRFGLALPVGPLTITMVESAFEALLMSSDGVTPLLNPTTLTTYQAAVSLSSVTVGTDEEESVAI